MYYFIIGLLIGSTLGILVMSILVASGEDDR